MARLLETAPHIADIAFQLSEFDALADRLDMTETERRKVLGMTVAAWAVWRSGVARFEGFPAGDFGPSQARRLDYALGLMRRAVSNLTLAPASVPGRVPEPAPV